MALLPPQEPCTRVILQGTKAPLAVRLTLLIIMIFCLLVSAALIANAISNRAVTGPWFLILILSLVAGSIYLLRLILWNTYGREIITLYSDRLVYIADYKLFRDGRQELTADGMSIQITDTEIEPGCARILFTSGESKLETVLMIPVTELTAIHLQISTHFHINRTNKFSS